VVGVRDLYTFVWNIPEELQMGILDFLLAQLVSTDPEVWLRDAVLCAVSSDPFLNWAGELQV
jgi:hypothetical protein